MIISQELYYIAQNSTYAKCGSTKGGGIACYFSAPIIRNNIIVSNETEYPPLLNTVDAFGGGIAVFWYSGYSYSWPDCEWPPNLVVVIENNTIAFNNDKLEGGGIAFRSVGARLKNNIIGCNFAENNPQIKVEFKEAPETIDRTIKIDYCNIEGGVEGISQFYSGSGNINKFPEFTDEEHWYLKRELSPCIDAGDPSEKYEDIEDPMCIDKACFPALGTKRNDIGAFGGPHSKWQEMADPTDVEDLRSIEIPNFPYLSQNYPNPFNPSTTIKYQIPDQSLPGGRQARNDKMFVTLSRPSRQAGGAEESFVTLKVYDILGREVATLVNEIQKPGNYEVEFDASTLRQAQRKASSATGSDLASGIYFYRLQVSNFAETKKMIMLR